MLLALFVLAACGNSSTEVSQKPAPAPIVTTAPAAPKPAPKVRSWRDGYSSVTAITKDNVEDWRLDMEMPTVLVEYDEDENETKTTIPPSIKKGAKITVDDVVAYLEDQNDGNCEIADDGCYDQQVIQKDGIWYLVTRKAK